MKYIFLSKNEKILACSESVCVCVFKVNINMKKAQNKDIEEQRRSQQRMKSHTVCSNLSFPVVCFGCWSYVRVS